MEYLREHFLEGGDTKKPYDDLYQAYVAAETMSEKSGQKYVPYNCSFCKKYHVGSSRV